MKKIKDVSVLITIGILVIVIEVLFLSRDLSKFKHKLAEEDIRFKAKIDSLLATKIAKTDSLLARLPDLSENKKE